MSHVLDPFVVGLFFRIVISLLLVQLKPINVFVTATHHRVGIIKSISQKEKKNKYGHRI